MSAYLEGKSIAVTGAGRGIGRAVALACAAQGANVVVNDYGVAPDGSEPTSEIADAVVKEIKDAGGTAVAVADDVSTAAGGKRIIEAAMDNWGRIDGVVAVAAILRERMLFNMSEEEWDPVIAVHLKGTFSVFQPASAIMRKQQSGTLIGFTSGAFAGSVAQANYSAAKGGIVSLVRSAAVGMYRYGVTSNCIAPTARTRLSANVPMELAEIGDPEDIAPLVVYLLSDKARHITGQVYSVTGQKIAVWDQPHETRSMYKGDGVWSVEEIDEKLDTMVGQERMKMLDRLDAMKAAADAGAKPNA